MLLEQHLSGNFLMEDDILLEFLILRSVNYIIKRESIYNEFFYLVVFDYHTKFI